MDTNTAIEIYHKDVSYSLVVAKRPITMMFLYRIVRFAYNESLYSYVRNNQSDNSDYYIPGLGAFQLQALDPGTDITVVRLGGHPVSLARYLTPMLGYTPELWSEEQVFEQFLAQTA
jgi:hypothetical protein